MMDIETAKRVMDDAYARHCKTPEAKHLAGTCEWHRMLNNWTYRELREAAACLVRCLDDYLIVEEAEKAAGGP